MELDEIKNYIKLSREGSVCVSIDIIPDLPNYLRSVTLYPNNEVVIKFRKYNFNEGGVNYYGEYESFEDMIREIEIYLGKPISEWQNFTKSDEYPNMQEQAESIPWQDVKNISRRLLPKSGNFGQS